MDAVALAEEGLGLARQGRFAEAAERLGRAAALLADLGSGAGRVPEFQKPEFQGLEFCFVDTSGLAYDLDTPYREPLGGSQSALCYLAERLGAGGARLTILNHVTQPIDSRGARILPAGSVGAASLSDCTAVVLLNETRAEVFGPIRRGLGERPRLFAWITMADDQANMAPLADPALYRLIDGVIFVSDWQAETFRRIFAIPADKILVLRNAIAPAFERLFPDGTSILAHKSQPSRLCYTSTPFRGLDLLVRLMPELIRVCPDVGLDVYSSMKVYQAASDPYAALYDLCRSTPSVRYVGSLPQPELAARLKSTVGFVYPSIFPETSCIVLMEAMAAGCLVLTSDLGALPETGAGFTGMVPLHDSPSFSSGFPSGFPGRFLAGMQNLLNVARDRPDFLEDGLRRQVDHVNRTATWAVRACEFAGWFGPGARFSGRRD